MKHWDEYFEHPRPDEQGNPIKVQAFPMSSESGCRQQWSYLVEFEGGALHPYLFNPKPLPINITVPCLTEALQGIQRQVFKCVLCFL